MVLQAPKQHAFVIPQLPGGTMLKEVGESTGEDFQRLSLGFCRFPEKHYVASDHSPGPVLMEAQVNDELAVRPFQFNCGAGLEITQQPLESMIGKP